MVLDNPDPHTLPEFTSERDAVYYMFHSLVDALFCTRFYSKDFKHRRQRNELRNALEMCIRIARARMEELSLESSNKTNGPLKKS